MLRALLDALERGGGGVGLPALSRQIGVEPAVVRGMLALLVQQGRVIEIGPDDGVCSRCPLQNGCHLLNGLNTRFMLVQRQRLPTPPAPDERRQ